MAKHDILSDYKTWIGISILFIIATLFSTLLFIECNNKGQETCNTCTVSGYEQGLTQGNNSGYKLGHDAGYKEGNLSGFTLCNETCVKPIINQTTNVTNYTIPNKNAVLEFGGWIFFLTFVFSISLFEVKIEIKPKLILLLIILAIIVISFVIIYVLF